MVDINEIKKELYKTKQLAKFSHYVSGNLYYTISVNDKKYQFPISVVDKLYDVQFGQDIGYTLSNDLGTTSFFNEMKGSELIRWITKAIDNNEFILIE